MKTISLTALSAAALIGFATAANAAPFNVAGAMNPGDPHGWDPANWQAMADADNDGIFEISYSGLDAGTTYEFKIIDGVQWGDTEITSGNQPAVADVNGNIVITYNSTGSSTFVTVDPNWDTKYEQLPITYTGMATPTVPGPAGAINTDWNVAGSFEAAPGWVSNDAETAMTDLGNNIYSFTTTIADAGDYEWKATNADWSQNIGDFGYNSGNIKFTTTEANQQVTFTIDAANGYQKTVVGVIPEPASLALLGLGGLAMLRRRK